MNKAFRTTIVTCIFASALVLSACAPTRTSESTGGYVDDSAITAKVKTAILQDPQLKVMEIHVTTFKDVVQLSGFVDTQKMVVYAGSVARNVSGVVSVQNNLIVK